MRIAAHVSFGGRDKLNRLLLASATANFDLVTAMISRTVPGPVTLIASMRTARR